MMQAKPQWCLRLCVFAALVFSHVSVFLLGTYTNEGLRTAWIDYVQLSSPVSSDLGLEYHVEQFDAKLFDSNIYRLNASDEVDAAWGELGIAFKFVTMTEDVALKAGVRKDHVKVALQNGEKRYPAVVEVFHQLHCLNLLRKAAWFNYDYYLEKGEQEFSNDPPVLHAHVGHCVDLLRQQLMCTADVGVVPFAWVVKEGTDEPNILPDFSTRHRCRDYDAIREWARSHQTPEDQTMPPVFEPGDRILDSA